MATAHKFKSQSGKTFTAEKVGDRYLINGVAKAEKQFGYFLPVGTEAGCIDDAAAWVGFLSVGI